MTALPTGVVQLGGKAYRVTETVTRAASSHYWVSCEAPILSRGWKPGEVRVGVESVFVCLTCKRHPGDACIHVAIVKQYVAGQAREVVPGAESTYDKMLAKLAEASNS